MKYSELINKIKYSIHPNKDKIIKNIYVMHKKSSSAKFIKLIISIALSFVLLSGAFIALMYIPFGKDCDVPSHLKELSPIRAVSVDSQNADMTISTTPQFNVTTSVPMSKKTFRECFKLHPEAEYTLIKKSGNTFNVKFNTQLMTDTVYTIRSDSGNKTVYSWAYQTETQFAVKSTYPDQNRISPGDSIYVEFTHANVESFAENFSISPAVSGTFEQYGKRWYFIPATEFENDVVYTVTVSRELNGGNNQNLNDDYSFSFSVENQSINDQLFGLIDTFPTDTAPIATFSKVDNPEAEAEIQVYSINTANEFISLYNLRSDSLTISQKINKYNKLTSFKAPINEDEYNYYLKYPEKLENGYYVAEITIGSDNYYQFVQVSNISVYMLSTDHKNTFRITDSQSRSPLSGIDISGENDSVAKTDENGLAAMDINPDSDKNKYFIAKYENFETIITPTQTHSSATPEASVFLQANSCVYKQNSTVKLIGFSDYSDHKTITLKTSWNNEIYSADVSESGFFEYELALPYNITIGKHSIFAFDARETLSSVNFNVIPQHSECMIRCSTDKDSYAVGEEIEYTVYILSSEGIPLENAKVWIDEDLSDTTSKNGIAKFSTVVKSNDLEKAITEFKIKLQDSDDIITYINSVKITQSDEQNAEVDSTDFTGLKTDRNEYTASETIKVGILDDGDNIDSSEIIITYISDSDSVTKVYTDSQNISYEIPDNASDKITVCAAYFDGDKIQTLESKSISIVSDKPTINFTTDKKEYLPGENVKFKLSLKTAAGEPIATNVNINVYDAALDFNQSEESNIPYHLDSPFYKNFSTDNNGNAEISFDLPKTSNNWTVRLTAVLADGKIYYSTQEITAKSDINITATIPGGIKPTDDCVIFYSANTHLTSSEKCAYTLQLKKDDATVAEVKNENKYGRLCENNFGKLESGKYKLFIAAQSDSYSKTAEYEFEIKENTPTVGHTVKELLESEREFDTQSFPDDTIITIYDEEMEFYHAIIEKISSIPATYPAQVAISEDFALGEKSDIITKFVSDDIRNKAVHYAVFADYFNPQAIKSELEQILYKSNDNLSVICCYLGLSGAISPILPELYQFNSKIDELNTEEKIYLALAFAYFGDYGTAHKIYTEHISDKIVTANSVATFNYDGNPQDATYLTAITTHLCAILKTENCKDLVKGLIINGEDIQNYSTELYAFVKNHISSASGKNKLTVTYQDGSSQLISYSKNEFYSYKLPNDKKGKIVFSPDKGTSVIYINTQLPAVQSSGDDKENNYISASAVQNEDELTVKIETEIPPENSGGKSIIVNLPYSLKYTSFKSESDVQISQQDNVLTIDFSENELELYVICSAKFSGEFELEPIVLINKYQNEYTFSDSVNISIE